MSYKVSAYHGENNDTLTVRHIPSESPAIFAADAAVRFAELVHPGAIVHLPGRNEQPENGKSVHSFSWTGSGLRIWVREEDEPAKVRSLDGYTFYRLADGSYADRPVKDDADMVYTDWAELLNAWEGEVIIMEV